MIRHFLFLLLWHGCLCVPGRPSKWHGKLSSSSGATLTAACGQVTTAKNNPWAAILYVNNVFQCGATILEHHLAITAAHCVLGAHTDDLALYYGRTFQPDSGLEDQGFDRFGGQTGISAVRIHPNYNTFDQFEGNDIAVLKLVRRIRFNDFVKPIRVVPTHHRYDTLYDRANVVKTASFGQTKGHINSDNPDDWPDQMQEVEHRIVPEQTCNRGNDTFHFGPPRDGVCTRGRCRRKDNPGIQANYKQICPGDSGSGVVRLFQEENQYYLLAVVSYTVTHDEKVCGLSSLPSLSINTRDHRDFIYEDIFATSNSNEKESETATVSTKNNNSTEAPTTSPRITTSHTTADIEAIPQTDRGCPGLDTCETKETCPYIRNKYKEARQAATTEKRKKITSFLKSLVCDKQRKAFCCPVPDSAFPNTSQIPMVDHFGRDITRTRDQQAMPEAMADFTQAFYTHMANNSEGKNFAFSPLGIHATLTMLYLGATPESNTERELGNSLYGLDAKDALKTEYRRIIDFYKEDPSFNYGNRIWTKKTVQIKQNYTNQVLKNMGADSETTEFNGEAVDKVNKWVNKITNGVIKDLVTEFDPDTKMFLSNVLSFKEDLLVDFSETDIQSNNRLDSEPFFILDEEHRPKEVGVEMMEQIATSDTYRYAEIEMEKSQPAKVVTIPYRNPKFEMQIILPGTSVSNGLARLEDQMRRGSEKLQDQDYIKKKPVVPFNLFNEDKYIYQKPIDNIRIKMPKFKISKKVEVSNKLQDFGVNQIFQAAELSQMTDGGQLTVSKVLHKAVIDVKHTGTTPGTERFGPSAFGELLVLENGKLTVTKVLNAQLIYGKRINVNQPFIFIIKDIRNKIPIIVGRVMDPRQTI